MTEQEYLNELTKCTTNIKWYASKLDIAGLNDKAFDEALQGLAKWINEFQEVERSGWLFGFNLTPKPYYS